MIVSLLEIFTEYMSIAFCMQRAAGKKILLDRYVMMFSILNFVSIFLAQRYHQKYDWIMFIVYINYFAYIKLRLTTKWMEAIKIFGIMLITIPSLQLVIYYLTKFAFDQLTTRHEYGVLVNCLVCILILGWKEKYFYLFAKRVIKKSGVIITLVSVGLFSYMLYTYNQSYNIQPQVIIQSLAGIFGIGVIIIMWIDTENEKKSKTREIQTYELYNKTYEETIVAIRKRQHEFDNHISAIKSLQLTINNPDELIKVQNEYCDRILSENSFNSLLKLHGDPVLTGFLYSKFMNAKEQGIIISHEVHAIDFQRKIEINELIELVGGLIDNAVEALLIETGIEKRLIIKILQEDENRVSIEVANKSYKILNSEIEKFCLCGYSTKGNNRGMGLTRVKEITKKYKADFYIENINYNCENYLSFKVVFNLKKRRN